MTDKSNTQATPYGYCPECGEPGIARERRPDGNDKCRHSHIYPSRNAHNTQPTPEPVAQGRAGLELPEDAELETWRAMGDKLLRGTHAWSGPTIREAALLLHNAYLFGKSVKAARASLPAGGVVELTDQQLDALDTFSLNWGAPRGYESVRAYGRAVLAAATPQPSETQGRRQMTDAARELIASMAADKTCDKVAAALHAIAETERHHGIPASLQDGGGQA